MTDRLLDRSKPSSLAEECLKSNDKIGAIVEYRKSLKIRQDPKIEKHLLELSNEITRSEN
jgi:hypothetical protein